MKPNADRTKNCAARRDFLKTAAATAVLLQLFSPICRAEEAKTQTASESHSYQPAPENLEMRQWFRDARFGIFIHWGVYSVLGEGEWVMQNTKMTNDAYEKLPPRFNPTKYDAAEWVSLFKRAGAKYVTITSKHHDGFAMWDSDVSDWDIVDRTPYRRDVLKPLAEECKRQGLKLFFYHSHLDWHHPDYFPRGMTGQHSGRPESGDFSKYLDTMDAQLTELLDGSYGQLGGIWFDGWWDQRNKEEGAKTKDTFVDWRLEQTYELIHRLQPQALIGNNHHVPTFAGEDFQMFERDLPGENTFGHNADATIGDLPLEACNTINGSWGYYAKDDKLKSLKQLIHFLVRSAGRDANLLLNVGPKPDGTIQVEFVERLEAMGDWLEKYGETIYGTRGGPIAHQKWGVATHNDEHIYLHVLDKSGQAGDGWLTLSGTIELQAASCELFDGDGALEQQRDTAGNIQVRLPENAKDEIDTILIVH